MKNRVLVKPILTEKTYKLAQDRNAYTFEVFKSANKNTVAKAVADKFDVKVEEVKIINVLGKVKRFGKNRKPGRRSNYKKAIVKLQGKDSIDLFEMK